MLQQEAEASYLVRATPDQSRHSAPWLLGGNPFPEKRYRSSRNGSGPFEPGCVRARSGRCHPPDHVSASSVESAKAGPRDVPCETSIDCPEPDERSFAPGQPGFEM